MNYVIKKKQPEIGDKGFIIGNRFVSIQNGKVNMPEQGLVFYASMNGKTPNIAETGQILNRYSQSQPVIYQNYLGIPCGYFDSTSTRIYSTLQSIMSDCTISMWIQYSSNSTGDSNYSKLFELSSNNFSSNGNSTIAWTFYNKQTTYQQTSDNGKWPGRGKDLDKAKWIHLVMVISGQKIICYQNGVQYALETNMSSLFSLSSPSIIRCNGGTDGGCSKMRYSSLRVYNRALTEKQIEILSKEFKLVDRSLRVHIPMINSEEQQIDSSIWSNVSFTNIDGLDCVYFNGTSSSYISPTFRQITGNSSWSFSIWCKQAAYSQNDQMVFQYGRYNSVQQLGVQILSGGSINFQSASIKSSQYNVLQWHNVAASYNGSVIKAYIDSNYIGQVSVITNINFSDGGFRVGRSVYDGYTIPFNGYVRDLKIYDRVLSQIEIMNQYKRLKKYIINS